MYPNPGGSTRPDWFPSDPADPADDASSTYLPNMPLNPLAIPSSLQLLLVFVYPSIWP